METYIALLYSIGVADGRRLIMAEWRALLESLDLQNPRTLIATGNAIFECHTTDPRALETRLEDAFERQFGRRVDTIVHPAGFFQQLVRDNPFRAESARDGGRVVVRVMREPLPAGVRAAFASHRTQGERVKIVRGHPWVHFPNPPNSSRLLRVLGSKRLGVGTVRNWNTIRRLAELTAPD